MDAHTVEAVSRQLLGLEGYFRRNGITVVLATHNRMSLSLGFSATGMIKH